jgi:hypothetical protein
VSSAPEGTTDYLQSDLRDTDAVLTGAARTLDFSQPVAVLLFAVLHFIADADDPYTIVKQLMDAVPAGSYLVICHSSSDIQPEQVAEMTRRYNTSGPAQVRPRSRQEVTRFFDGLDLIDPGVVPLTQWLSHGQADAYYGSPLAGYVGVARKPSE